MAYWLGEYDSAYTVDRVLQAAFGADSGSKSANGSTLFDLCSTIVPKCRSDSLQSSPLMLPSASKRRLNLLLMTTPSSLLGMKSHGHKKADDK